MCVCRWCLTLASFFPGMSAGRPGFCLLQSRPALSALTCLGVSSLVGNLVNGVQQLLLVAVRVQPELGTGVVAELGDGHLSDRTRTRRRHSYQNHY